MDARDRLANPNVRGSIAALLLETLSKYLVRDQIIAIRGGIGTFDVGGPLSSWSKVLQGKLVS